VAVVYLGSDTLTGSRTPLNRTSLPAAVLRPQTLQRPEPATRCPLLDYAWTRRAWR